MRILQAQQEEIRRPLGEGNGSVKYYLKSTVREEDESLARSMDDSGASSSASHHSGAETSMDSFSHEDNYVRRARQAAGGRSTARREMSKTAQARLGKTDDDLYQVDEDDDEDSEGDDGLEMDVPRSHYTRQTRAQAAPPSVRDMTPRATRMAVPESPPRVTISSAKGTQQVLPAGYTTRRRSEPRSKSPLYHDGGHWWQSLKSLNTRALIRRWWKMALGLAMCVLWLLYISSRSRSSTPDTPSTSGSPTTPDHDNTPESARRPQSPSYATPPLSNSADWRKLENQVHDLTRLVEELTKRRVPAVEQSVASLGSRVDILEREIRNAFDEGQATEWLRRILPSALPVRYDGDGNIHIEPSVYTALNKVLLGEHALERHVREAIMTGRFDEAYESAVERIFGIDSHAGSLATRNEVVKLISTEVQSLELKLRADRKQTAVDIKHGGKDVTPAIQALIDAALLKFSKDMGTGRDYALYSAGGRILPTHTTDTMAVALVPSWASWLKGTPTVLGRDPSTILTPRSTNNVGVCWPFVGDAGQAGVKLARRIVVTAISLEHAPSELVMGIDSAPKNVEIVSGSGRRTNLTYAVGISRRGAGPYQGCPVLRERSECGVCPLVSFTSGGLIMLADLCVANSKRCRRSWFSSRR